MTVHVNVAFVFQETAYSSSLFTINPYSVLSSRAVSKQRSVLYPSIAIKDKV